MPTLVYQVAAGADDGHYAHSTCNRTGTNAWMGGSDMYHGTVRFDNVLLTADMRITSAKLYLKAASSLEMTMNLLDLGCDDSDDAGNLIAQCNASARTMTTARTVWTETKDLIGNVWYWSPSFASAVQEVIDRVGWVSGNAIAVLGVCTAAAGTGFQFITYESDPAGAPMLYISYASLTGGAML